MSDNKQNAGKQDDIRVDRNNATEVDQLHQQYPTLTPEEVKEAIKVKGPLREDILKFLDSKTKK
jgi:hypothetical protein